MGANTQRTVTLILQVFAMAMGAVSLALALVGLSASELYGIVLGIGLFALAVAAIIAPGRSKS